jgi:two-component system cell cycle response regulator PopA
MRIAIRSPDARAARALQARLALGGVEAMVRLAESSARTPLDSADIVLLDGAPGRRDWLMHTIASFPAPRASALAVAGATHTPPDLIDAPIDGWIDCDAPAPLLQRQCAALVRAVEARMELALRKQTASHLKVRAPETEPLGGLRLLYIGAPDPLYLELEELAAVSGAGMDCAFSSFTGFDRLHEVRYDAVIVKAEPDAATALALCGALRRNARLHHTPTLMLVKPGDAATLASAYERGACAVLAQGEDAAAAFGWLNEAVRAFRRHAGAEIGLNALRLASGGAEGLFDPEFFRTHLDTLTGAAVQTNRPLSLAALRVTLALGAREPDSVKWARELTQVAALTGRLIRTHDSAALLEGGVIMIAAPGAFAADAAITADRVASVAECTAFAASQQVLGPIILARSIVELAPGESGDGLMRRALSAFEVPRAFGG